MRKDFFAPRGPEFGAGAWTAVAGMQQWRRDNSGGNTTVEWWAVAGHTEAAILFYDRRK